MLHLGIDLGTTYSLVASLNSQGVPTLFPDFHDANEFRTPSVIHIGEEGCLVGNAVEELLEDEPGLPHARFVKLSMGSEHPVLQDNNARAWSAEAVSALVLKKLIKDVEAFSSDAVGGVVIAVPANFSDAQRRATRQAAWMAGLPSPRLVEEPVAAATYYGYSNRSSEQTLFVYDLGGGTFDATLLQAADDGLFVLATEGTKDIGGKNVDEVIMNRVAEEFARKYGVDPREDVAANVQLRRFATDAKLKLSKPGARQVRKTLLISGKTIDYLITKDQFESLIDHLVRDTLKVSEKCLMAAGLSWESIDKVLLTGGSSLLPLVTTRLTEVSGILPANIVCKQPHQAVAFGAALIAGQVFGAPEGKTLRQVSSYDLGIRVMDKVSGNPSVQVLIEKNTPIPAQDRVTVYTNRPEQTRMIIEVVQRREGEGSEASLGYFAFGPITKPHKNYPVEVTLAYDAEGMVKVTARDSETGFVMQRVLDDDGEALGAKLAEQQVWVSQQAVNA